MKIETFDAHNQVVFKLYRLAYEQPIACFQTAALELLKTVVGFDSAVWGNASLAPGGIDMHTVHLHRVSPEMVAAYEEVKHLDSASGGMLTQAQHTQAFHTETFFAARAQRPIRDFMRHFEQPNFSIHTQFNAQTGSLAWPTAYRVQADEHFRSADIDGLGLLVPHLMQALGLD